MHFFRDLLILTLIILVNSSLAVIVESQKVLYLIIGQNSSYNRNLAQNLKGNVQKQYAELHLDPPQIFISNEDITVPAAWTIIPLIESILRLTDSQEFQWVVFLEDYTYVNVESLLNRLTKYNSTNDVWIGHALHDSEATIIHHFAFHKNPTFFRYPNLGSGFVVGVELLKRLNSRRTGLGFKQNDFHIDAAHEFALFVFDEGKGPMIENDAGFCSVRGEDCATYPKKFKSCGFLTDVGTIFFAIKTCQKFHDTRVRSVKRTWLAYTRHSRFFSDVADEEIPTVSLNIPNTEYGHCEKTISILKYLQNEFLTNDMLQWLALVDDDTILSVSRMVDLTTCHPRVDLPLILGERYRFGQQGFDYLTGGAGILINRAALNALASECTCPRPDSPDDMIIGACADRLGIPLIHVPQLHQARPDDYAPGRLATKDSITFHKHWMIDPIEVYQQWFSESDKKLGMYKVMRREEL